MDSDEKPSKNKQAGIFSSPDLTVDTEKLASHRAASPTGKPDIPVRHSQHDKRKITFIIIIVATLVLMGIVVLTLVMSSQSSTNQGIGNEDSMSSKESLNRYVGFLISGKTGIAAFTDADFDPRGSKLYSVVYSGETNTINSYFSEAQALLDSFLKQAQAAYTSTSSTEEELVLSLAESNKLQLGAIKEYAVMEEFDMTGSYISLGATDFQQEAQKYYDGALQSSNEALREIAEAKRQMANAVSSVFGAYENYGCISNKSLVESCSERILWTNEMLEAQDAFITAQDRSYQNANRLFVNLFSSCKNLVEKVESIVNNQTEKK